jgi:hypothetical protein
VFVIVRLSVCPLFKFRTSLPIIIGELVSSWNGSLVINYINYIPITHLRFAMELYIIVYKSTCTNMVTELVRVCPSNLTQAIYVRT